MWYVPNAFDCRTTEGIVRYQHSSWNGRQGYILV
eukprot:COSAG01_NODE_49389_length_372_cov_1.421245_1_plen_33_part_10